jgi:hypothetical protein
VAVAVVLEATVVTGLLVVVVLVDTELKQPLAYSLTQFTQSQLVLGVMAVQALIQKVVQAAILFLAQSLLLAVVLVLVY